MENQGSSNARRKYIATVSITILLLFIAIAFQVLGTFEAGVKIGLFPATIGEVTSQYKVRVNNAPWCLTSVWVLAYISLAIWMSYSVLLMWRKSLKNEITYKDPALCTSAYMSKILVLLATICLVVTYTNSILWASLLADLFRQITLGIALGCALKAVRDCRNHLHRCKWEVFWAVLLVHNPLGITLTAICYHVAEMAAQVVVYDFGASQSTGSAVAYVLLVAEMVAFYIADISYVWTHTLYLFTPYLALIWLYIGAVAAQTPEQSWEKGFTIFLLSVSMVAFVLKLSMTLFRVHVLGYRYDVSCREQTDVEMLPRVNLWFIRPWTWRKLRKIRSPQITIKTFETGASKMPHMSVGRPFYIT